MDNKKVVLVTGGTSGIGLGTIEYLLDDYVEAYTNADIEKVKDMFPPFYIEYAKNSLTEESLQNSLKAAKEEYGDDFFHEANGANEAHKPQ